MNASGSEILCRGCGSPNREAAKFCGGCGASLAGVVCAACGSLQPESFRFCDECGTALPAAAALNDPTEAPGEESVALADTESEGYPPTVESPLASRQAHATTVDSPPVTQSADLSPRTIAAGRYEVEKFLGAGARKRVYLATDRRLGRQVAIALVDLGGLDEKGLMRARREAEAMARLSESEHIVTVFDTGEESERLYLVTEYMSRGELSALRERAERGRLPVEDVLRIGAEVAHALEHAHAQGVIHRDLKPQNIWLGLDGGAKLGDFGLAVAADRSRLTVEGAMIGTVSYMPPEQALGRTADARSDIYSLGAVLYELLCGTPPFAGDDAAAIISQHVSTPPIAPAWHRSDIPQPLDQLILRMLAKAPDERPQDATEVREDLEAITSVSAGPQPQDQAEADTLERLSEVPLVGREQEVRDIRAAVDAVVSGRGRIVMIAGEQGIGKTRLATEAATYASLRGCLALWGRCVDDFGAPPYWPWVQIIRTYVADRDSESLSSELGQGAPDIAQIVSEIRERLPELAQPGAMEPEQARFRLFDSIANFLANISRNQPLALILDDLHTADRPSLLLLEFIAKSVPASRLLIVGTYRHDELDQAHPVSHVLATLGRQRGYQRLRLAGLSQDDVVAMLENASAQRPQTPDELALVRAVHRESEGNPYFIEEIMRHLVESGRIYRNDEGIWISDVKRVEDLGIPEGIRDAIGQRMAELGEECTALLKVASVIGREFQPNVLAEVADGEPPEVQAALEEADEANVVRLADDGSRYTFVHATMRDALRAELSTEQRVELHRRTGEVLEELYEDRIESHLAELAHHFVEAAPGGDAEKAADYAWWAGEQAVAQHAYEDAVGLFEAALRLLEESDDEPARGCELQLALGDARWRLGDTAAAKETFLSAAKLARSLSLTDAFARAALGYGGGIGGFGVADRADETLVELLRAALKTLPEQDTVIRVRVLARLSVELYLTDAIEERNQLSDQAVEIAERIGDPGIHLLALYSRQWAITGPDELDRQLTAADEILHLARAVEDREMRFRGHHFRLNALLQLGDIAAVDREIKACGRLAEELRQPYYLWQAAVFRAMRALLEGRFADGEQLAQEAFQLGQQGHAEMASVIFGAHAFVFCWGQSRLEELVAGGEAFAEQYPDSAWPAALALLYSEAGEEAKSRAVVNSFMRKGLQTLRRDANWMTAMLGLSMGAAGIEEAEAAERLYDLLLPYADRYVVVLTGAAGLGSTRFLLGVLARTLGRWDDAVEHLEEALRRNERAGVHYIGARAYDELALALLGKGTHAARERGLEQIDKGIEVGRRLEMQAQVERLLALRMEALGMGRVEIETSIDIVAQSVELDPPDLRAATAPDGTVTIMFSDIEDSTVLTERLGDRRWLEVLHRHNEIVRDALERHDGFEVKSQGDGFMLAFASARSALHCAIAIQRELAAERQRAPESPLRVRIGLHTGEVLREESDFFGKNVILAARIAGKASGDEILVSSLLREIVSSSGEFAFGEQREVGLKGLAGTHRVFDLPWSDDVALVETADGGRASDAGGLPLGLSSFIGRESELAEVRSALTKSRMVTLAGPGGAGKTRLALEIANEASSERPGGLFFVELGRVEDPALVPEAVLAALGGTERPGQTPLASALAELGERRALMVLDNCEHLPAAAAEAAAALLAGCPNLRLLATSRESRLGVSGESVIHIAGLTLPGEGEDAARPSDAVRLFVERARQVRPAFAPDGEDRDAVTRICRDLDGLPLAIELAASRLRVLSASQIADTLGDKLRLLSAESPSEVSRHRTLRASIEWSHDLLDEGERILLRRCAVFAGGFTLDSAEAICAGSGLEPNDVLELVASLAERSLIVTEERGRALRYRLLETVRQYAAERLGEAGEEDGVREAHARYFRDLAAEANALRLTTEGWERLDAEEPNLRAALEYAAGATPETALGIAAGLSRWWLERDRYTEGRAACERALAVGDPDEFPGLRSTVNWGAGFLALFETDFDAVLEFITGALAQGESAGDALVEGRANALAAASFAALSPADGVRHGQRAVELLRETGDRTELAWALAPLSTANAARDDHPPAREAAAECIALADEIGDTTIGAWGEWIMGAIDFFGGDPRSARDHLSRCLELVATRTPILGGLGLGFRLLADAALGDAAAVRAEGIERLERLQTTTTLGEVSVRCGLAGVDLALGDLDGAHDWALPATECGILYFEGNGYGMLARIELAREDAAAARAAAEDLRLLADSSGNQRFQSDGDYVMGCAALLDGDLATAATDLNAALETQRRAGFLLNAADTAEALGLVAAARGDWAEATGLLAGAATCREGCGASRVPPVDGRVERSLREAKAALGDERFAEHAQTGASATV